MANSSALPSPAQKNRARPGFCSAFAGVLNAQALEGLVVSAADMAEARSTHPATARKPMDGGERERRMERHHSHSWRQLLLLLARNSEERLFVFGRIPRPFSSRHLLTVETGRWSTARHFAPILLRQYAAIERSMRMEHPSQRNNGIDGSATQPF